MNRYNVLNRVAKLCPHNDAFGRALAEQVRQRGSQFSNDEQRRVCWALDTLKVMDTSIADMLSENAMQEATE